MSQIQPYDTNLNLYNQKKKTIKKKRLTKMQVRIKLRKIVNTAMERRGNWGTKTK